ncbi:MAG: hypothetical protein IPN01_26510 [Deltaproteobacteria bacterium]|nr:hypothetical protein [Deltaproteobacteria bacterium]
MRSPVPLLTLLGVVGCTGDVNVTKFNSEPVATITSPGDGDTVTEGQLITLRGIVSDPDDPASNLVATWTAGERSLCERVPVGDGGESSCEATLAAGEEEITLLAQDPANAVGLDSVTVVITTPNAPTLTWLSPQDGDLLTADVPVELAVQLNDDADEPAALALAWTDGDGAALDLNLTPDADGVVRDSLLLAEGSYTVTLTATDSDGLSGVASMSFVVEAPNNVPTCEITAPLTGSNGPGGEPVLLSGLVFDADQAAETLSVAWSSDLMGLLGEVTPSADGDVSLTVDELSAGTHALTLSVLDAVGASCEAEVLYSVGIPPELELLAPIDGDLFNEGELVSFVATASDAETAASDLIVTWESDLDGLLDESFAAADGSILFETTALSPGEHNVTLTVTDGDGLYVVGTVLISVNDLPGAPTVSLSPSSPGTDDTLTASVTGPSADAEGDPITYTYAWTKDGAATAYSSTTVPATATTKGELWAVTVTPDDGWGAGDVGTASVTIQNTAPTLTSVSLTPTAPSETDTLTCTPSGAADVDGDSVSYEYAWTVNGVLISTTTSTLGSSFWQKGDTISCAVTPTDGVDDGAAVSSASVTVGNGAPSITGVTISPSSATVSSTLTCAVTGFSDPDGDADASTFAWTVDGVAAGSGATLAGAFVGGDVVTCTATPSDGSATGATKSTSITIGNTAPVLASVSLTPTSPTSADTLTCTPGSTTDADGTTSFTYSYAWTVNGSTISATGSTLAPSLHSKFDVIRCAVTPNDGSGSGSAVSSSSVTIGNSAPSYTSATLSPSSPTESDTLTCTPAGGSDTDGDTVSATYVWRVNGSTISPTTSTLSGTYFSKGQSVVCDATPTDGTTSGTAVTSNTVTVLNSAPTLTSVSISPSSPTASSTLTCTPSGGADADGDTVSYTYAWTVNGTSKGSASTLSGVFVSGNTVVCSVTPSDGSASGTAKTATVTISNSAPVLASVSLTPTSPTSADTLTCTPGSTTDADGTTSFTYTYAWTVNGSTISATSSTLGPSLHSKGDVIRCAVTPSDGSSSGSAVSSSSVTIQNSAPSYTSASLSPTSPTESDTLTCTPSGGSDTDGDTVSGTYSWRVNGSTVSPTTSTLSGTYFSKGQTVVCLVTPTDGTSSGTAVTSNTVTVLNTAPTLTSVSISPSSPTASSTLTCTPSGGADVDGDTVSYTYAWTVNGTARGTSSTLSGVFVGGNTVVCSVTPSDGSASGTAKTATVTISNSAPVISSVSLTPTSPTSADTLTCTPTTTDADGTTSFTYTYAWTIGGSSISATSSTLGPSSHSKGDVVRCSVIASDGSASSASVASSSVTIGNSAPSISSVTLSSSSPKTNDTLSAAITSSDTDGDTVSYTYAWFVNGSAAGTGSTLSGVTAFSKGQSVYVRVTPTDGTTAGSAVSSSTATVANSTPGAPGVELDPEVPEAGVDDLWCAVTTPASDDDGDTLSYTITWTKNGSSFTGTTTTVYTNDTVPYTATSASDTFACRVTASDGSATSAAATDSVSVLGATYTVGNATAFHQPHLGARTTSPSR